MHLRHFALTAAILVSATAYAADRDFDRTLPVSGAATLDVSTGSGYLHIYSGSGNQVHIVGHVHSRPGLFGGDADKAVSEIADAPPITQSGNTITIKSPHDNDLFRHVSIDYDITAPASSSVAAHSGSGGVEIGGIQGQVTAGSGSGSIHVDNIGGNAHLETGSGSIDATNVHGAANVQTGSGHIRLAVLSPGEVRAHTGSGSIELSGINGGLRADTGSGRIEISGNPTSEWRVQTGSGSVEMRVPADARFDLDADTGSGGIHTDRPITVQSGMSRHHMSGSVNGGGPTLRISTGSGSISIR